MFITQLLCKFLPSHKLHTFNKLAKSTLPYYFYFLLIVLGFTSYLFTHNSFMFLFFIYGITPLLDEIFTLDTYNPTPTQSKQLQKANFKYQLPLYLAMLLDWYLFFWALNQFSRPLHSISDLIKIIGFVIFLFNNTAGQFVIAHQLFHKPGYRRIFSTFHMIKALDMHFTYQHIYGHHRRVSTPQDPATSYYNQNVYHFVIKSYFGSYKSVYQMQLKNGKYFFNNYSVLSVFSSLLFSTFIFKCYGLQCLIFFLLQAFGAVFYLQVINYIEHYGLKRKKLSNGEYQKVTILHSWNAPHRISNYMLFKLQRHSDHHENSMKPYQTLLSLDQSPQLPHGYVIMTVMSLFPQTFKKIMNPLLNQQEGNQNIENLASKQEQAVLETRKFVIKVTLCATIMCILSLVLIK